MRALWPWNSLTALFLKDQQCAGLEQNQRRNLNLEHMVANSDEKLWSCYSSMLWCGLYHENHPQLHVLAYSRWINVHFFNSNP